MHAAPVEPHHFRRACSKFATGVTIVTVLDPQGAPHGMTVNSFTSVSLAPPLILVCVDHRCKVLSYLRESAHFGVNILKDDQQELSAHFARVGHDRFDGVEWYRGETGAPLLPNVLACFECVITKTVAGGDHSILISEVLHATIRDGQPLIFFNSQYQRLLRRD